MIVVSDTTPLRYLAVLGHLDVLPRLFGSVHCPDMVIKECTHPRAPAVLRTWASAPPEWLKVAEVHEVEPDLAGTLDPGEAAAITLAMRLGAEVILIDERDGRRTAQARGFATAGTLNILAQAGLRNWLDYHATVERLRAETNFRATQVVTDAAWLAVQS
ncbi:MAG: hypothetical protein JNG86_10190 [Verrucomicrobiaceae bacterium]|nr:hypothetical protein [Verrucomicrobiaceae bacterium]